MSYLKVQLVAHRMVHHGLPKGYEWLPHIKGVLESTLNDLIGTAHVVILYIQSCNEVAVPISPCVVPSPLE